MSGPRWANPDLIKKHPKLKGFDSYYRDKILPGLAAIEARRTKKERLAHWALYFLFLSALVFVIASFYTEFAQIGPWVGVIIVLHPIAALFIFAEFVSKHDWPIDNYRFESVGSFFGFESEQDLKPDLMKTVRRLGLGDGFYDAKLKSYLSGKIGGLNLRFFSTDFQVKFPKKEEKRYGLDGLVVEFDWPMDFQQTTFIDFHNRNDQPGTSKSILGRRVYFDDLAIGDDIRFYTQSRDDVSYLLTPAFRNACHSIYEQSFNSMTWAFDDGKLVICYPFQVIKIEKTLSKRSLTDTDVTFVAILQILRIIEMAGILSDCLMLDPKPLLREEKSQ